MVPLRLTASIPSYSCLSDRYTNFERRRIEINKLPKNKKYSHKRKIYSFISKQPFVK